MIQRILNIISSVSLLVVVFLINKKIGICAILKFIGIPVRHDISQVISIIIYVLVVVVYAWILTRLFSHLRPGELRNETIEELDADNSGLLAMILAYIFVGLSITNGWSLIVVLCFLVIFYLHASTHIFNPLFYLFGYHYYYIKSSKTKYLMMTKTKYPLGSKMDFPNCRCLNDYTFIDMSK